jgi:hypothetical protein
MLVDAGGAARPAASAELKLAQLEVVLELGPLLVGRLAVFSAGPEGLARWLLGLGILATLAANVAHGWPNGPVGAVVAAWPAASLVGSYELLLWLIRTSAACALPRERVTDQPCGPAGQLNPGRWLVPAPDAGSQQPARTTDCFAEGSMPPAPVRASWAAARVNEPGGYAPDHAYQPMSQQPADWSALEVPAAPGQSEDEVNTGAVAAYRASLGSGKPLSERKLAAMFGKTSRRWARSRIAEARQLVTAASEQPS